MKSNLLLSGGGGFYGPQGGPNRMLKHFLRLTGKPYPKVCLIPTATGDKPETIHAFVDSMNALCAHPNYLSLYKIPTKDLESWLLDFDAIYVTGGNTRNLLALWREWKLEELLLKAMQNEIVVGGSSAGAICWFEQGCSDFIPGESNPLECLGLIKGSCCPHYSDGKNRRQSYLDMVKIKKLSSGYGISDRAALHYVDGELHEALVEWDEAGVYRVERMESGEVKETRLTVRTV